MYLPFLEIYSMPASIKNKYCRKNTWNLINKKSHPDIRKRQDGYDWESQILQIHFNNR
jgi:hypothetical protein